MRTSRNLRQNVRADMHMIIVRTVEFSLSEIELKCDEGVADVLQLIGKSVALGGQARGEVDTGFCDRIHFEGPLWFQTFGLARMDPTIVASCANAKFGIGSLSGGADADIATPQAVGGIRW